MTMVSLSPLGDPMPTSWVNRIDCELPFEKDETPEPDEMVRLSGPVGESELMIDGVNDWTTWEGMTGVPTDGEAAAPDPGDSRSEAVPLVAPPRWPETPSTIAAALLAGAVAESDMMASR